MPVLTTERLVIRPFAAEDLQAVHTLLDQDVRMEELSLDARRRWLDWTILSERELARLFQPPYGDRAVLLGATGEMIGACGLVPLLAPFGLLPGFSAGVDAPNAGDYWPEVGLFYAISSAHRGQGYASEAAAALAAFAFEHLRLRRLLAATEHENLSSQAVMRRLGMRLERNPHPEPAWLQVVGVLDHPAASPGG